MYLFWVIFWGLLWVNLLFWALFWVTLFELDALMGPFTFLSTFKSPFFCRLLFWVLLKVLLFYFFRFKTFMPRCYFCKFLPFVCLSFAQGALWQSTVIYYETYLYSKMLLLQVLAASPSAPRTDKQERNMPRPWKNLWGVVHIMEWFPATWETFCQSHS